MANYSTQAVVNPRLPLDDRSRAVLAWCRFELAYPEDATDPTQLKQDLVDVGFLSQDDKEDPEGRCDGLTAAHEEDGLSYLYAEEHLDSGVRLFLEWLIRRLPATYPWITVEWADTCSKMRNDGFGGGAWFITREGTEYVHTSKWLTDQMATFKEAQVPSRDESRA